MMHGAKRAAGEPAHRQPAFLRPVPSPAHACVLLTAVRNSRPRVGRHRLKVIREEYKIATPLMSGVRQTLTEIHDRNSRDEFYHRGLATPAHRFFLLGTDSHLIRPLPIFEC